MKGRKLLSAIIAGAMVLGTMSFPAFAEGDVASIGDTTYTTLAAAVEAAKANDTIKLVDDTTESGKVTITGKTITIDFDGHTLNGSILINGNSVVTVEDGYIRQTELVSGIEIAENANVTINNMDVESFRHAIRVDADNAGCVATAVINGGKYLSTNNTTTCHGINIGSPNGKSVVTIYDGEFYGPVGNANGGNSLMIQNHNDDVKIYGGYFAEASGIEGCICPANGLKIYGTNSPKFGTWSYDSYVQDDGLVVEEDDVYIVRVPVAEVNENRFASLQAAVTAANSGDTVKLLSDASGDGVIVPSGSNIAIDLGGYTYNIDGTTVGSAGTETNGFQLLRDSNITIKNGTITSDKAKMLIQNYSNLTLENVTLDGRGLVCTNRYVLSNNNGDTVLKGNTNIIAKEGDFAFDCCYWPAGGYGEVRVTLGTDFTGKITGEIEKSYYGATEEEANANSSISISGGTFTTDVSDFLADGYKLTTNTDGTFGVAIDEKETEPEILKQSRYVTYSQLGKFDFGSGEVDSIRLSLFAGVDTLNYSKVGFDVTLNGETQSFSVTDVYDNVKVNMNGEVKTINASEFGEGVKYIFGQTINVPATDAFKDASVKWVPYAIRNKVKITGDTFNLGDIFPGELEESE